VTLVNMVTFAGPMREAERSDEVLTMSVACHNGLAKLKIHAEEGVEAVMAEEGKAIVRPIVR
jgi:hypothetical protein